MNTKLTLNIDKEIIEEAKIYAKSHSVSLSKLIENYLNSLTRPSKKKSSVSPLVESLTGIIPSDYDERKEYRKYIQNEECFRRYKWLLADIWASFFMRRGYMCAGQCGWHIYIGRYMCHISGG